MPSRPPSPLASMPSSCVTSSGSVPCSTRRIRPVVRSPTSAAVPPGNGARPHGAARQVAITAASVGAHGSGGGVVWPELGDALEPGADGDGVAGDESRGTAPGAVSDGWTVNGPGSRGEVRDAASSDSAAQAAAADRVARRRRVIQGIGIHGTDGPTQRPRIDPVTGSASALAMQTTSRSPNAQLRSNGYTM